MKTCPLCQQTKPLSEFHRARKNKDGRYPYCKVCVKARQQAMYAARGRESWLNDKTCTWCQQLKPRAEFRKTTGKAAARCLTCEAEISAHEAQHERRCNICRLWLSEASFYASKLRFPNIACQECTKAQTTKPAYRLRARNYTLQKEYGITLDQYKELLERQGHKCPICKVAFDPGNFSYPVDHAHGGPTPGCIRAILHQDCNRFVMWMHEDSAQLRAAADLIDNPLTDWIVAKPTFNERKREKERRA